MMIDNETTDHNEHGPKFMAAFDLIGAAITDAANRYGTRTAMAVLEAHYDLALARAKINAPRGPKANLTAAY